MSGNDWWNRKQATEGPTFTRPERFETMIFAEKNLQSICLGRSFHEWSIQPLANSKDSKVGVLCKTLSAWHTVLLARQMTGRSALNCIAKALGKRGSALVALYLYTDYNSCAGTTDIWWLNPALVLWNGAIVWTLWIWLEWIGFCKTLLWLPSHMVPCEPLASQVLRSWAHLLSYPFDLTKCSGMKAPDHSFTLVFWMKR